MQQNQPVVQGQSDQDLYTYSVIQSQNSNFVISTATQLQTIVIPAQPSNLARSVLSFKLSAAQRAANVTILFHNNIFPWFEQIKALVGGTQILHIQKYQEFMKMVAPYRNRRIAFIPTGYFKKGSISFTLPFYIDGGTPAGFKNFIVDTETFNHIQSHYNRQASIATAGTTPYTNATTIGQGQGKIYPDQDSFLNMIPYDNLRTYPTQALENENIQIQLCELLPFTYFEKDICYDYKQGIQLEFTMAKRQDICFLSTRTIAVSAADAALTQALDQSKFSPASTIATMDADLTISNFQILSARPTRQSQINRQLNHLVLYPYLDYQTASSFTFRSGPGSKGTSLNLQLLSYFVTSGAVDNVSDFINDKRYNNASRQAVNGSAGKRALTSIELISDGLNVLQNNDVDSLQTCAFVLQNFPYERIGIGERANYKDMLYQNYTIPLKYYKNGNVYDGKDNMTKEVSLSWNATLGEAGATANSTIQYTFYLVSIYTRMLSFDAYGNCKLT